MIQKWVCWVRAFSAPGVARSCIPGDTVLHHFLMQRRNRITIVLSDGELERVQQAAGDAELARYVRLAALREVDRVLPAEVEKGLWEEETE